MATFIMSYPGPSFRPATSTQSHAANPASAAMTEWLALCDHITRAGGRIFVVDPPEVSGGAPQPELVHAGRIGALFPQASGGAVFLLSPAAEAVAPTLKRAGLTVERAAGPFGGQVDVISLSRNRFVLTYRGEEGKQALAQARALLPPAARVLEFALRDGVAAGTDCLCAFTSSAQHTVVLLRPDGLEGCTVETMQSFAGEKMDVIPLGTEDAAARASTALAVRGTLILPTGLSTFVRGVLVRHGFHLVEIDLPVLGADGGGPSTLVSELVGFVVSDEAPSYALRREELQRLPQRYEQPAT